MKPQTLLTLSAAALAIFVACSRPAWADAAAGAAKPKMGVTMAEFDDNFETLVREAVSKEARVRGWQPVFGDARSDQSRQNQQVQDMIAKDHVSAIVVLPVDTNATSVMTNAARAAGVALVYVNRKPTEAVGKGVGYVGSQDVVAGHLQADYVTQQLGGKGDVAIMVGQPSAPAAQERTKGVKEALAQQKDIHVVAEEVGNWQRDQGLAITKNWLAQGKKIDAIVANNDEMAIGAIMALRKAGKAPDSVLIMGVDATPDGLAQMDKGAMKATVYQDATGQGKTAVDLAIKIKAGEAVPDTIDIPFKLITRDNYKELMAY